MLVDDDSTSNLIGEFVIKNLDPGGDINLFEDPEVALLEIKRSYGNCRVEVETILFLDLNMPTMSGWEFLEVFKELDENLQQCFRIYILTSSIEDYSAQKDRFPFVKGFLSKPLNKGKLKEILSEDLQENRNR